MERDDLIRLTRESGLNQWELPVEALERFAGLVATAERTKLLAPMIVDVSHIDKEALAEAMKRARPVLVAAAPATRREHIDALVGDRLTADKADHICERDGYTVTGVVLSLEDGRACIVNRSAVRWLHGARDLWNLLFTDSADNVARDQKVIADFLARSGQYVTNDASRDAAIAEAVAAEREACAQVCEAGINNAVDWDSSAWDQACENRAIAIRARGAK